MKLRPARPTEAAALARILTDWARDTPWMPKLHTPNEDAGFLYRLIRDKEVTVVASAWRVQGFMARDGAVIHALYLRRRARRRGWGRALLDLAKSRSDRLELWCFQANAPARGFYAAQGFTEAERTDGRGNDEALPDVRLEWERTR